MKTVTFATLILALAAAARAQGPEETWLDDARRDAPVTVRLLSGERVTGVVHRVLAEGVEVSTPNGPRTVPRAAIVDVRQRVSDSLANGAVIGAAAGGGAMLGIVAALSPVFGCHGCARQVAVATALWAGAGAGIGALVDAAIRRDRVVYAAPRVSAGALIGPAGAGVGMRVVF